MPELLGGLQEPAIGEQKRARKIVTKAGRTDIARICRPEGGFADDLADPLFLFENCNLECDLEIAGRCRKIGAQK